MPVVLSHPGQANTVAARLAINPWQGATPVELSSLPAAKLEAERIRDLFPNTQVWRDQQSNEQRLKSLNWEAVSVLHVSAHAVLDDRDADRSALVLAPGSNADDGLLQVREIARLPLAGQLITLASCQTAIGTDIAGEGVMSLARAFLVSGAAVVVGSLWPIEDNASSRFFDHFYSSLAQGDSVRNALRHAQIKLIHLGYDARAWAGFAVLGDGDWRMAEAPRIAHLTWLVFLTAVVLMLPIAAYAHARVRGTGAC